MIDHTFRAIPALNDFCQSYRRRVGQTPLSCLHGKFEKLLYGRKNGGCCSMSKGKGMD